MSDQYITIITLQDASLISLFSKIEILSSDQKTNYSLFGIRQPLTSNDNEIKILSSSTGRMISTASINISKISITYHQSQAMGFNAQYPQHLAPHPVYSTIKISVNDNDTLDKDFIFALKTEIDVFLRDRGAFPGAAETHEAGNYDPTDSVLATIHSASIGQIDRVNSYFSKWAEEFESKREHLEKAYSEKTEALHEKNQKARLELEHEIENLDQRKKELDDRDNTHARRSIRGELIRTIQDRQKAFGISSDTLRLRTPIHLLFAFLILSTFAGAVWSLYVWGTSQTEAWNAVSVIGAVKSAVFTFGFLTSSGLYISWMNRWFDKHSDAQFHTKQFEIDINRATWVIESALEWKAIQGEQMPEALLAGITNHLFENQTTDSTEYSPLEVLATSVLGAASNLKMNLGGSEITLDRKSLKTINKIPDSK